MTPVVRRPRRRRFAAIACLSAAAAALGAVPAHAQPAPPPADEAGPVFGQRKRPPTFGIEMPDVTLSLVGERNQSKLRGAGADEQTTQTLLTETVTLRTQAYIVHPNLVDLSLAVTIGLRQSDFQSEGVLGARDERGNDVLDLFDVSARILREATVNGQLYAQRREDVLNRDFGPSLTSRTTTYGAAVNYKSDVNPAQLNVYRSELVETDPAGLQGFRQDQNVLQASVGWVMSQRQGVYLGYVFSDVHAEADTGETTELQSHQVTLNHNVSFGSVAQHMMTSSLEYNTQSGDQPEDRLQADERLTLQWTPHFSSYARYSFTSNSREALGLELSQTRHVAEIGTRHKLYDSLVTNATAGLEFDKDVDDNQTTEWYGRLDFDYTKKVPWGTFIADLGAIYTRRTAEAQSEPTLVLNESRVFADPLPIVIPRQRVTANSINITDAGGLRRYSPLSDYQVIQLPDRVEIRRVLGGAIPANGGVLIDYTIDPQPANTTSTLAYHVGGRYNVQQGALKDLSVFARYYHQSQEVEAEVSNFFLPNDVSSTTIGASYRVWDLTLSAEHNWYRSSLAPYTSTRLQAQLSHMLSQGVILGLNADYTLYRYEEPENTAKYFLASGTLGYQVTRTLQATLGASWRDERNDLFSDSRGFEQSLQVTWRHRQTLIYGTVRNVSLDTDGSDESFQFFQLGIQRDF